MSNKIMSISVVSWLLKAKLGKFGFGFNKLRVKCVNYYSTKIEKN